MAVLKSKKEVEQAANQLIAVTDDLIKSWLSPSRQFRFLAKLIENLDENVAPEYKDVFVRRVVMRYLQKTPTPDNDEDADNLLLMYRIMGKFSKTVGPLGMMKNLRANYDRIWQFYRVYAEVLIENSRQSEVPALLDECMTKCGLSSQELAQKLGPPLANFLPSDEPEPNTMAIFGFADDKENVDVSHEISDCSMDAEREEKSRTLLSQSLLLGTPGPKAGSDADLLGSVPLDEFCRQPHEPFKGAASLVGVQLAQLLARNKPSAQSLSPASVLIKNPISTAEDLDEALGQPVVQFSTARRPRVDESAVPPAHFFVSCLSFLLFGHQLDAFVLNGRLTMAKRFCSATLDGELLQRLADQLLNDPAEVDWQGVADELKQALEEEAFITPAYLADGVEAFNHLYDSL